MNNQRFSDLQEHIKENGGWDNLPDGDNIRLIRDFRDSLYMIVNTFSIPSDNPDLVEEQRKILTKFLGDLSEAGV